MNHCWDFTDFSHPCQKLLTWVGNLNCSWKSHTLLFFIYTGYSQALQAKFILIIVDFFSLSPQILAGITSKTCTQVIRNNIFNCCTMPPQVAQLVNLFTVDVTFCKSQAMFLLFLPVPLQFQLEVFCCTVLASDTQNCYWIKAQPFR